MLVNTLTVYHSRRLVSYATNDDDVTSTDSARKYIL